MVFTLLTTAFAASLNNLRPGATFSLNQIPIDSPDSSIAETIRAPYFKFGVEVPVELEDAIIRDVVPGQTSVPTKAVNYDQAYGEIMQLLYSMRLFVVMKIRLIEVTVTSVQIGNQTLLMDIDTGSSDL